VLMKLRITDIDIGNRIRHEVGDLSKLKESIVSVGLLNPVIINSNNELLSGLRRLEACRQLGWNEIEVRVIETDSDEIKDLDIEYHENMGRLDFNEVDEEKYTTRREELLNPPKPHNFLMRLYIGLKNFFASLFNRKK